MKKYVCLEFYGQTFNVLRIFFIATEVVWKFFITTFFLTIHQSSGQ